MQGDGIGEEQKRREQIKKTERDLRVQKEDNERKNMEDKHKGENTQTQVHRTNNTHTMITYELGWCTL